MANQWQIAARDRLVAFAETGEQDLAGRPSTLRVDAYTSPERAELERRHVFGTLPLVVGASCQIRSPGDFLTHDASGVPLLITRERDGALRAMLNVCRHRGSRVVREACGSRKQLFSCPYHGWTYDAGGALCQVPQAAGFPDLERKERGLVSLPVAEVGGLIFVRTTPGPDPMVRESLGPLAWEIESLDLASRKVLESSTHVVKCNWKLMVESALESYHIPTLHKDTGATFLQAPLIHHGFGPSSRFLLPYKEEAKEFAKSASVDLGLPEILTEAGVVFTLFPNTVILFLGACAHVLSTFPVDEGSCRVTGTTLVIDRGSNDAMPLLRMNYEGYWATIREDFGVVESIQAGMRCGANQDYLVGRHEFPIAAFHEALDTTIARSTPGLVRGLVRSREARE